VREWASRSTAARSSVVRSRIDKGAGMKHLLDRYQQRPSVYHTVGGCTTKYALEYSLGREYAGGTREPGRPSW
jgi:hypothetical protein